MSRRSLLSQLKEPPRKSIFEFEYDNLTAPPILALFTPMDIQELIRIATSVRYAGNMHKKYELIDNVMRRRGFVRAHCGTNRVVYNYLESKAFIAKVALDKVGMTDSPREYINQAYFAPFCCKIFEVDPSGVIAFVERVNPISSIDEFLSVADDIFNMMVTKIIGKYVVDDLGTRSFMNFGIREDASGCAFGPVIIDFPYVYELDGAKLKCNKPILNPFTGMEEPCGGDIDYKAGFNGLICTKCGREYKAMDLAKETPDIKFEFNDKDKAMIKYIQKYMRARLIDGDKILLDSGRSSKTYVSKEEYDIMTNNFDDDSRIGQLVPVVATERKKRIPAREYRDQYYTALQRQYYNELAKKQAQEEQPEVSSVVKHSKRANSPEEAKPRYVDPIQTERHYSVSNVASTVDRQGNPVSEVYAMVDDLENATFPELRTSKDYKPDIATEDTKEVIKSDEEGSTEVSTTEDKSDVNYYEYNQPEQVYSDEQVKEMAHEVALQANPEVQKVERNTILNAKADETPEASPFIRPYANAGDMVNVNHKITADEEQPYVDDSPNPMDASIKVPAENTDYDNSSDQDTEEVEEEEDKYSRFVEKFEREDHKKNKHNKKTKRNPMDYN